MINILIEANICGSFQKTVIDSKKFFDPIHIKIFDTIEKLIAKGLLANPITLKNYFENNEGLKELGGQEYLIKITKFSTTSVKQAIDYANQAKEQAGQAYLTSKPAEEKRLEQEALEEKIAQAKDMIFPNRGTIFPLIVYSNAKI